MNKQSINDLILLDIVQVVPEIDLDKILVHHQLVLHVLYPKSNLLALEFLHVMLYFVLMHPKIRNHYINLLISSVKTLKC
jgi:hypothetical protein